MSPKKLSPNNLTDAQLVLLSAAAQREDGAIKLAPNLKGGAADKVVGTLLTQGLIEEIPARGALPIWHRDEGKGPFGCTSPRAALRPSGSLRAVHCWRLRIATAPGEGPILHATSLPAGPLRRVARKTETRLCDSRPSRSAHPRLYRPLGIRTRG
jgi:hypothetical protein